MDKLTALSLSIGGLAGVATFLAVGPASGLFFIWHGLRMVDRMLG